MADLEQQLAQVPLFKDLDKKGLERLGRIARQRPFTTGDVIVKEGDEGVGFFLIVTGAISVTRGDQVLSALGPGDFFGEMALIDNFRRSATCTATEPTECIAMSRWDFDAELRANPDIAMELLVTMSRRLREVESRLAD